MLPSLRLCCFNELNKVWEWRMKCNLSGCLKADTREHSLLSPISSLRNTIRSPELSSPYVGSMTSKKTVRQQATDHFSHSRVMGRKPNIKGAYFNWKFLLKRWKEKEKNKWRGSTHILPLQRSCHPNVVLRIQNLHFWLRMQRRPSRHFPHSERRAN